jgi:Caspase domain
MTILPDPYASQAVLIGVAKYSHLEQLPTVDNNLAGLQMALTDPLLWGLPALNCRILRQPRNANAALNALQHAATAATDALIVYFGGHGLIDPENDDELYLALPDSDKERAYRTAMPYGWLRRELQTAQARRKVVILDCCYSGRALGRWMGEGQGDFADRLEIAGTCVLTATARTRKALAPPDDRFTAFTGELLSLVAEGIPGGPDLLDMDTIYRHLTIRMRAKGLPLPQRGQTDHGGDIALANNRSRGSVRSASPSSPRPKAPSKEAPSVAEMPRRTAQWRGMIDSSREPVPQGLDSVKEISVTARRISVFALLGWAGLSAWLAYAAQPDWWLAAAGFVGFVSLLAVRYEDFFMFGLGSAIPTLLLYVVGTLPLAISSWPFRVWIIGTLILFFIAGLIRFSLGLDVEQAERATINRQRQLTIAGELQRSRWLSGAAPTEAAQALLNQLGEVPAARFASMSTGRFSFLVVAGTRIALAAFVDWPPGEYTRPRNAAQDIFRDGRLFLAGADELTKIIESAAEWQQSMKRQLSPLEAAIRIIVVVRPKYSSTGVALRLDEVENNMYFVTPDTFADNVGPFLVEGAYEFNLPVIEWLKSRLENKRQARLSS